ncbi:type VI secretion system Vgr family protein [Alkalilimnicola sp. S0819]|uniref:type VI secretion system Vgr family protein n=1 Tax=Alkalilimnicola sp. S0819 TaxID=2613922 RepID=UPI00126257EF|nr:type VI secretion system tip protein TssI/VgrG [Alkalilimnicola sp. S0819]KAB7622614.1 type VI secretion system tip protein VgrG [Alkalilimnicola sp. S0819]MPQ17385.1 type VI secretion system tip protein VgrG [Alkalilimnicola sp. S0819]
MGVPISGPQERRLLRLETPLGADALIPRHLSGSERLSAGFEFQLEAYSDTRHGLGAAELIGRPVGLGLATEQGAARHFHALVNGLEDLGRSQAGRRSHYRLKLVPWLWLLGQRSDCRVFQRLSIPQVLERLTQPLVNQGLGRVDFSRLRARHPVHRYLVQYNETDLNALNRWAAREGIAYYFTHQHDGHTLHFIDDPLAVPLLDPETLLLTTDTPAQEHLRHWSRRERFVNAHFRESSYNYQHGPSALRAEARLGAPHDQPPHSTGLQPYRDSEDYLNAEQGRLQLARRAARETQQRSSVRAEGDYRCLRPGHGFRLRATPGGGAVDEGRGFTLSGVHWELTAQAGAGLACATVLDAVPRGELVYPQAEQPRISGLQTAVVTGQQPGTVHSDHGEDALGRVRVRFHWDREQRLADQSSCWLRVMQQGGGRGVSAFYALPRVGDEVVVAFENGNPDRPFVLGALPHPQRPPPYGAEPGRCGIRTESFDARGAAPGKWNELRFDDRKNAEEVYLRAEKDFNSDVLNDLSLRVGRQLSSTVGASETRDVADSLTITAGARITLRVGGNSIVISESGIDITGGAVRIQGSPVSLN